MIDLSADKINDFEDERAPVNTLSLSIIQALLVLAKEFKTKIPFSKAKYSALCRLQPPRIFKVLESVNLTLK